MAEATAAEAEQEHGQRVAFLTEAAETLENFISRLCTRRGPPDAMRVRPMICETSDRRRTAARISASRRSIS